MRSLRGAIAWRIGLGLAAASGLVFLATYSVLRHDLLADFDARVVADLRTVASLARVYPDGDVYVDWQPDVQLELGAQGPLAFQLWDVRGVEGIDRSPWVDAELGELPKPQLEEANELRLVDHRARSGRRLRLAQKRIDAQWGWNQDKEPVANPQRLERQLLLTVARDRAPLDRSLARLGWVLLGAGAALPLLAGGLASLALRRGLAPLGVLTSEAARIESTAVPDPFSTPAFAELAPIGSGLNRLLARLDSGLKRERRFLADAAHELRTPLAELRTLTDVALLRPEEPGRLARAIEQTNGLALRMGRLVEGLLTLARGGAGELAAARETFDLAALVGEALATRSSAFASRRLVVEVSLPAPLLVSADPAFTRAILDNLLDNLATYAVAGSSARVELERVAPGFALRVRNLAAGLEESDLERLFEPFWRRQQARTGGRNLGLGLALCRAYAEAQGWRLEARSAGESTLELALTGAIRLP